MKSCSNIFLALVAIVLLSGCQKAEVSKAGGTLVIESLELEGPSVEVLATRSVDSRLAVEILDASGNVYQGMQYSAGVTIPASLPLPAGSYTLHCYSENLSTWPSENGGLGGEAFESSTSFAVLADDVTHLSVKVPMINFGVSLSLPQGFEQYFTSAQLSVVASARAVTIASVSQVAYFPASSADFSYTLSLQNVDGESYTLKTNTFEGARAGVVYRVQCIFSSPNTVTTELSEGTL